MYVQVIVMNMNVSGVVKVVVLLPSQCHMPQLNRQFSFLTGNISGSLDLPHLTPISLVTNCNILGLDMIGLYDLQLN